MAVKVIQDNKWWMLFSAYAAAEISHTDITMSDEDILKLAARRASKAWLFARSLQERDPDPEPKAPLPPR